MHSAFTTTRLWRARLQRRHPPHLWLLLLEEVEEVAWPRGEELDPRRSRTPLRQKKLRHLHLPPLLCGEGEAGLCEDEEAMLPALLLPSQVNRHLKTVAKVPRKFPLHVRALPLVRFADGVGERSADAVVVWEVALLRRRL